VVEIEVFTDAKKSDFERAEAVYEAGY
jgi:hypothetical protein